jgi:hypothetical protein
MSEQETEEVFKITCPRCKHEWPLSLDNIRIYSCESDGIYGATMTCPECRLKLNVY